MILYEQLKAHADQKMARYQGDADKYRMRQAGSNRPRLWSNWLTAKRGRFGSRSGASRVGGVFFGEVQGPVQPAI